jgi:arabinan endo-1,5-alpha-L-arabinosidase
MKARKAQGWMQVVGVLAAGFLNAQTETATNAPSRAIDFASLARNGKREGALVHDPSSIVKCKDEYWLFTTGPGVSSWRSKDLVRWERGPRVFTTPSAWITNVVARSRGNFWAPDVIFHEGRYLLYYSVSQFGVNTSAIALASNPTLDPADPNYRWTDHGIVIQTSRSNNFNAIDPQIIKTAAGELWLAFGSFWSGIKLIQLDARIGQRLAPDSLMHALAYHKDVEAAAIHQHGDWFYLFVNWGACCRGVNSTYEIRMGRSREITGPYLDKDGVDLVKGGGTLLLGTDGAFIGPGHAGVFEEDGKSWFSCHFYDGTQRGTSMLAIRPLRWDTGGWPVLDAIKNTDAGTAPSIKPQSAQ